MTEDQCTQPWSKWQAEVVTSPWGSKNEGRTRHKSREHRNSRHTPQWTGTKLKLTPEKEDAQHKEKAYISGHIATRHCTKREHGGK